MRFIQLTEAESGEPVVINATKLDLMYRLDDRTVLRVEGSDLAVQELPEDVLMKIRG
jgi:uncharacterized protein YlzI (FlbEa/FlbD family)